MLQWRQVLRWDCQNRPSFSHVQEGQHGDETKSKAPKAVYDMGMRLGNKGGYTPKLPYKCKVWKFD